MCQLKLSFVRVFAQHIYGGHFNMTRLYKDICVPSFLVTFSTDMRQHKSIKILERWREKMYAKKFLTITDAHTLFSKVEIVHTFSSTCRFQRTRSLSLHFGKHSMKHNSLLNWHILHNLGRLYLIAFSHYRVSVYL